MRVEVVDNDLVGDDFIGYANVALDKCFETPGKWAINQEFELLGDTKMKKEKNIKTFGYVYLQVTLFLIKNKVIFLPVDK